jgi:glycosyltransferase involved in cell wall biosynthesis
MALKIMFVPSITHNAVYYDQLREFCLLFYPGIESDKKPSNWPKAIFNAVISMPIQMVKIYSMYKNFKPDVIITNGFESTLHIVFLRKMHAIHKSVVIVRDWNDLVFRMYKPNNPLLSVIFFFLHRLDLLLSRSVDGLVVVSNAAKCWIVHHILFEPWRILVLYEAVPLCTTRWLDSNIDEKSTSLRHNAIKILMSGVIRHYHIGTLLNVVRAVHECNKLGKNLELHIAGPFEEKEDQEALIKLSQSEKVKVILHGPYTKDRLTQIMNQSHVALCILPDRDFTRFITTMKLSEALSHGLPVVCSNLPGLKEICGDACSYVKPDDPHSIAYGLITILNNYASFTQRAKKRANELFSEKSIMERVTLLLSWLANLVKERKSKAGP